MPDRPPPRRISDPAHPRTRESGAPTPSPAQLAQGWRARAAQLRHWGGADGTARTWELAAEELDDALRRQSDDVLSLGEAAAASGYSADHLARLIREGKIPNAGRPNAPRVRRGDLPRKAGALPDVPATPMFDPTQIARSVVNSMSGAR